MNRRNAVFALTALGITPLSTRAQPAGKVYRIGYLSAPTRKSVERAFESFLTALRNLGWVEGKNLLIEYRWADGNLERLPALAAELVALKVELIVAPASIAALAAKNATSSIPIVMIFPNDPVTSGLVASLRRPGGNVTGTAGAAGQEILGKQLQLLKEIVPQTSRVTFLWDAANPDSELYLKTLESAARALHMRLQSLKVRSPEEFEGALASVARDKVDAMLISGEALFLVNRKRLAELAVKYRLPIMCNFRESVEDGGLAAYAVNMSDFIGQAARYIDKILKGAKPADLPVEQPTTFELVVNKKTAAALGIKIPGAVLLRADRVIE
jgi:putative ABC transport system substrate-binding protein